MKYLIIVIALLISHVSKAQTKEFVLLDNRTKKPISNVNVFNPNSLKGTISNADGRVKISIDNDTLTCSHIAYEIKKIVVNKQFTKDTLLLIPKKFHLDEVVVTNIDLKKKLQFVLDNYDRLYDTKPKIMECTNKEKLKVNGGLARLFQVQMEWWDKSYKYNFKEKLEKQNRVRLISVDYSKRLESETIISNGGFLKNNYLFEILHLNYYPIYLTSFGENIAINSIEKGEYTMKIVFNADIVVNDELIAKLVNSVIYFDNKTGAIKKLEFHINYLDQTKEDVSRISKIPYRSSIKIHCLTLSFSSYANNKLILNSFYSDVIATAEYRGKVDEIKMNQSILVTGIKYGKKLRRKQSVDLSEPFYVNFPANQTNETKILLTEEELNFIRK